MKRNVLLAIFIFFGIFVIFSVQLIRSELFPSNSTLIALRNWLNDVEGRPVSTGFLQPTKSDIVLLGDMPNGDHHYQLIGKFMSVDWDINVLTVASISSKIYKIKLDPDYLNQMQSVGVGSSSVIEKMWSTYPILLVITWNDSSLLSKNYLNSKVPLNDNNTDPIVISLTKYEGSEAEYNDVFSIGGLND